MCCRIWVESVDPSIIVNAIIEAFNQLSVSSTGKLGIYYVMNDLVQRNVKNFNESGLIFFERTACIVQLFASDVKKNCLRVLDVLVSRSIYTETQLKETKAIIFASADALNEKFEQLLAIELSIKSPQFESVSSFMEGQISTCYKLISEWIEIRLPYELLADCVQSSAKDLNYEGCKNKITHSDKSKASLEDSNKLDVVVDPNIKFKMQYLENEIKLLSSFIMFLTQEIASDDARIIRCIH